MKAGFLKNITLKEALEKTITMLTEWASKNPLTHDQKRWQRYYVLKIKKYKTKENKKWN